MWAFNGYITMRNFIFLWSGQLLSGLGSSLSGFALGVWIYQQTGSVTQFAITTLFYILPFALLASFAGTLVDRWDRRQTMIWADSGQAAVTLILALLLSTGQLVVWHVYLAAVASASLGSFQGPAYGASIALLVPKEQLSRAAGMGQISNAVSRLVAPVLAGFLVITIGLRGVLFIDLATFGVAIVTYLFIHIPSPPISPSSSETKGNLWRETLFGWQYLFERPGLLCLILIGALRNYFMGIANVLTIPLVLSFATADKVGFVLALGSLGPATTPKRCHVVSGH
jgi:MFS transporter, DHA3 family, macrolide efflux protein